jgi:hypothetical protein
MGTLGVGVGTLGRAPFRLERGLSGTSFTIRSSTNKQESHVG